MELAAAHSCDVTPGVLCKPNPRIYQLVAEHLGVAMSEVIFFDDSMRNVAAAHGLGALTVLVGTDNTCPGADIALPTMHHLPAAMPELLDQPGLVHEHSASQGPAQELTGSPAVPVALGGMPGGSGSDGVVVSVSAS